MADKKLILRVLSKLFATIAVLAVAYVFMLGVLSSENNPVEVKVLWLDVSSLKPGEIKYLEHERRQILVLSQGSGNYLVAYARDPVFNCPIEWQQGKFISVCNGSEFDLDGKVYAGQRTDEDLKLLDFVVDANDKLKILVN